MSARAQKTLPRSNYGYRFTILLAKYALRAPLWPTGCPWRLIMLVTDWVGQGEKKEKILMVKEREREGGRPRENDVKKG